MFFFFFFVLAYKRYINDKAFWVFLPEKISSSTTNPTNLAYNLTNQGHVHLSINFHKELCILSYIYRLSEYMRLFFYSFTSYPILKHSISTCHKLQILLLHIEHACRENDSNGFPSKPLLVPTLQRVHQNIV